MEQGATMAAVRMSMSVAFAEVDPRVVQIYQHAIMMGLLNATMAAARTQVARL